jgi:hypothetical protein
VYYVHAERQDTKTAGRCKGSCGLGRGWLALTGRRLCEITTSKFATRDLHSTIIRHARCRTQKASQPFVQLGHRNVCVSQVITTHNSSQESGNGAEQSTRLEEETQRDARTTPVSATRIHVHTPVYIHVHIRHACLPEKSRKLTMSSRNISVNPQAQRPGKPSRAWSSADNVSKC